MPRLLARRMALLVAATGLAVGSLTGCSDSGPSVSAPSAPASSAAASGSPSSSASETSSAASSSESSSASSSSSSSAPSAGASPASSAAPGSPSALVHLCGPSYNAKTGLCPTNASDLTGSDINCSADLPNDVTGSVAITLYRNGSEMYGGTTTRPAGNGTLHLSFKVGKLAMPGGTYACQFKAGSKTFTGKAEVKGPGGVASQTYACDGTTMFKDEAVQHCTSNNPKLTSPKAIGCSTLITGTLNKDITVVISTPDGPKQASTGAQKFGAAVVHLNAPASAFGGTIKPGAYSCSFQMDGAEVAKVAFTVA